MHAVNDLFFFYGSLRTGYWNQHILSKEARRIGSARTVKPFGLYISEHGTVPTCIPGEGFTLLKGDLYWLNKADAASVFGLERGYHDGEFEVMLEGKPISYVAHIFHHTSPEDCSYIRDYQRLIPSGDYTTVVNPDGSRVRS